MGNVLSICKELTDFWNKCSYGILRNGKLTNVPTAEYFDEYFRLMSPEQFKQYKGGICYDFVEFGDWFLSQHNIPFEKYYMYTNIPTEDTHTFIIIPYENEFIYIEGSFKDLTADGHSVRLFDTRTGIFQFIAINMFKENDNYKLSKFNYWVWKYTEHPPYGCDAQTFTTYTTQGEPIYEGTSINPMNIKSIKLRRANPSDVSNIYKWTMDTIDKKWWNEETYRLIKRDAWESIHKTRMVMLDGKTIGMVTAYNYTYDKEPGFWYIAEIYLVESYRGQGMGRALLQNEIDKHDKLLLQVNKDNFHAINLYKSLGFKTVYETDESYEMVLRK